MEKDTKNTNLFSEFSEISTQTWMDKIIVDLKGANYEKKMIWRTNEGFNVQPFYRQEDLKDIKYLESLPGEFPFIRGNHADNNSWFVRQDLKVTDAKATNAKALDILNKGITSLGFIFEDDSLITAETLNLLFNEIALDCIEVNFVTQVEHKKLLSLFIEYLEKKGYDKSTIIGSIDFDPIGDLVLKGKTNHGLDKELEEAKALIEMSKDLTQFRVVTVNGKYFNNGGAVVVQDLGYTLSMGNDYLAKLTEKGISIDVVAQKIKFNVGIGGNYFMEIAKLRAARMLWANIVEAYNPSDKNYCKMIVHSETSDWNKTIYDPNVNMLRTQTEAMSATIGGSHSVTVKPFNIYFDESNVFSERIARNQQLLLKEESHFEKIVDPSAGSYYIETLTDLIGKEAWKLFVEVENKGGFVETLKEGFVQQKIKEIAEKRKKAVATRRENLLGTNQFPNTGEMILDKIDETKIKEKDYTNNSGNEVNPVPQFRGSEDFETLRLATEKSSHRPKVFMLTYGNLAMRLARSQFSGNFFGCAGYEIIDNLGFETIEKGVEAAKEAGADIVVLCSSDDEYADAAPVAYDLLGDTPLVVAGAPACADDLKEKGIKYFVNVRSNVLETLQTFNTLLGIKS